MIPCEKKMRKNTISCLRTIRKNKDKLSKKVSENIIQFADVLKKCIRDYPLAFLEAIASLVVGLSVTHSLRFGIDSSHASLASDASHANQVTQII